MEAILFNHIIEKKHKDSVSLSSFMGYLTTEGHQIQETEHTIFSYGFDNSDSISIVEEIKRYEQCFIAAKKCKLINRNVTNVGYTDCIDIPNVLTDDQIQELTSSLNDLSPDVASVFVLHKENNAGDKFHHLHHIRLCRSKNALVRIDEKNRQNLVQGTKGTIKKFYLDQGFTIKQQAARELLMSTAGRNFARAIAIKAAANFGYADVRQGSAELMKSSLFWTRLAKNKIAGIDIRSQHYKTACAQEAKILDNKKAILECKAAFVDDPAMRLFAFSAKQLSVKPEMVATGAARIDEKTLDANRPSGSMLALQRDLKALSDEQFGVAIDDADDIGIDSDNVIASAPLTAEMLKLEQENISPVSVKPGRIGL